MIMLDKGKLNRTRCKVKFRITVAERKAVRRKGYLLRKRYLLRKIQNGRR